MDALHPISSYGNHRNIKNDDELLKGTVNKKSMFEVTFKTVNCLLYRTVVIFCVKHRNKK